MDFGEFENFVQIPSQEDYYLVANRHQKDSKMAILTTPAPKEGVKMTYRELLLGMDGRNTGQYAKMPIRNPGLETFADNSSYTHRSQIIGYYGWMETGIAVLDQAWLLLGAC